jgi:ribosomal protein L12E/L44/L45/RPP1/RPP2
LNAANVKVAPYWPSLFARVLSTRNVEDLILSSGGGSGGAVAAAPAATGGAAPAAKQEEKAEKKEEKKKSSSSEHGDLGGGLFGGDVSARTQRTLSNAGWLVSNVRMHMHITCSSSWPIVADRCSKNQISRMLSLSLSLSLVLLLGCAHGHVPVIGIVGVPTAEGCITQPHVEALRERMRPGDSCFNSYYVKWVEAAGGLGMHLLRPCAYTSKLFLSRTMRLRRH